MRILSSAACAVLLILSGCATPSSTPSPPPRVDPPTCPAASFRACEPPVTPTGPTLGATETADAENRTRWLVCIEQHSAWLACAANLIDRGFLRAP